MQGANIQCAHPLRQTISKPNGASMHRNPKCHYHTTSNERFQNTAGIGCRSFSTQQQTNHSINKHTATQTIHKNGEMDRQNKRNHNYTQNYEFSPSDTKFVPFHNRTKGQTIQQKSTNFHQHGKNSFFSKTATHNTTMQHNTTQHNTTQHNTTQHNTTQHNTTQHNTNQTYQLDMMSSKYIRNG